MLQAVPAGANAAAGSHLQGAASPDSGPTPVPARATGQTVSLALVSTLRADSLQQAVKALQPSITLFRGHKTLFARTHNTCCN